MQVIDEILSAKTDNQIHLNEGECCFISSDEIEEYNKSKDYNKTFHIFVKANSKDRPVTFNIFKFIDHGTTIFSILGVVLDTKINKHELVSIQYTDGSTLCIMSRKWCYPILYTLAFIAAQYLANSNDKDKIMKLARWIICNASWKTCVYGTDPIQLKNVYEGKVIYYAKENSDCRLLNQDEKERI